jgi:hypothetical protein
MAFDLGMLGVFFALAAQHPPRQTIRLLQIRKFPLSLVLHSFHAPLTPPTTVQVKPFLIISLSP